MSPLETKFSDLCKKYGFPAPMRGEKDWHPKIIMLLDWMDAEISRSEDSRWRWHNNIGGGGEMQVRTLTEAEIQKELEAIDRWPSDRHWVFMKNIHDQRAGYTLQKAHRYDKPITIVHHYGKHAQGNPPITADSLADLIKEGWVVD